MKTNSALLLVISFAVLSIKCHAQSSVVAPMIENGMVKVTIMYPNGEGKTFDMNYYANKHMPMLADLFGDAMKLYTIDKGVSGRTAEDPIPYLAIGYMYFDKLSDYETAFGPNAEQILGDIPNYTNIRPIVQISEVVK